MSFIILFTGILLLILLITWLKFNPFLAFLIISLGIGFANGMSVGTVTDSVQKGMGDLVGSLLVILVIGAMLGKLIADSGAAQRIVTTLMNQFGKRYIVWALVITGFIVGIPLFYGIGFVLMVPLIITLSYKYDIPAVYIGLPMLASLSVTHGYLPPHPSPSALVVQFHANMGKTLLYGMAIAIPAVILAGPVYSRTLKHIVATPLEGLVAAEKPEAKLPGIFNSLFTALLPVILLMLSTLIPLLFTVPDQWKGVVAFLGDPSVILLVAIAT